MASLQNKIWKAQKLRLFFVALSIAIISYPFSVAAGDAVVTYPSPEVLHAIGTVDSIENSTPIDGDIEVFISSMDKKTSVSVVAGGFMLPPSPNSIRTDCNGNSEYFQELNKTPKNPVQNLSVDLGDIKVGDRLEVEGIYSKTTKNGQDFYCLDLHYVSSLTVLPKNSQ